MALRGQLQKLGVLRESGHEHFNGSVVFPVFDGAGQVCEVYGRKVNDNLRPGTPLHLYLPGPHRGVWNAQALTATDEIILCESLIDALTFWCSGYRHVTASYGIEGFTAEMLAAFKAHRIARVLIAYDRDAAGDSAATALASKLLAEGMDCYRVQVPKGMDVNDYARQVTPASKALGVVLRAASWLGKGQAPPVTTVAARPSETSVTTVREVVPVLPLAAVPATVPEAEPACAPVPVLPASPMPPAPHTALPDTDARDNELVVALGDRRYRLRGLDKNGSFEVLKVNL